MGEVRVSGVEEDQKMSTGMGEVYKKLMTLGRVAICGEYLILETVGEDSENYRNIYVYEGNTGEKIGEFVSDSDRIYYRNDINQKFGISIAVASDDGIDGGIQYMWSYFKSKGNRRSLRGSGEKGEKWEIEQLYWDTFDSVTEGGTSYLILGTEGDYLQQVLCAFYGDGIEIRLVKITDGGIELYNKIIKTELDPDSDIAWAICGGNAYLVANGRFEEKELYVAYKVAIMDKDGNWDVMEKAKPVESLREIALAVEEAGCVDEGIYCELEFGG